MKNVALFLGQPHLRERNWIAYVSLNVVGEVQWLEMALLCYSSSRSKIVVATWQQLHDWGINPENISSSNGIVPQLKTTDKLILNSAFWLAHQPLEVITLVRKTSMHPF